MCIGVDRDRLITSLQVAGIRNKGKDMGISDHNLRNTGLLIDGKLLHNDAQ